MSGKILISDFPYGQITSKTQFNIDNNAFVSLFNFYCWRGRVVRKPGTETLGRFQRTLYFTSSSPLFTLDNSGSATVTLKAPVTGLSISLSDGTNSYTDSSLNGNLTGTPNGSGSINYATGVISIAGGAPLQPITGKYSYFPSLPVLGLESKETSSINYQDTIGFDTLYSYMFNQVGNQWYSINFYKGTNNPFVWSGEEYRQFWSVNYQGAFWATNFKPGFHAKLSSAGTITLTYTTPNIVNVTIPSGHSIPTGTTGVYVWFNEFQTPSNASAYVNGWSGLVTTITSPTEMQVTLSTINETTPNLPSGETASGGLVQYLNFSDGSTGDGIRWLDGDPTNLGDPTTPTGRGWVNFSPPVSKYDPVLNPNPQYIVGALCISEFKDRLLFFAPYLQTSIQSTAEFFKDQVAFCWNGTPYYSYPLPTDLERTYTISQAIDGSLACAWWWSPPGFGGYQGSGLQQQVISVGRNEDVLLVDFEKQKTKLVYTSNDLRPFEFYGINTELTTTSTFSSITMDQGKISVGSYGIALTTQTSCDRIDLDIPDYIFTFKSSNFGIERTSGVRDFRNEYIFFTYCSTENSWEYPTRSLLFNYRNNTWATLKESFTTQGLFQRVNTYLWGSLGAIFGTWGNWNVPFGSGRTSSLYPNVIAGNAQGFVVIKTPDTVGEAPTGYVTQISISGEVVTITSPNHCLEQGDYIYFNNCLGITNINSTNTNSIVFRVSLINPGGVSDTDRFTILAKPNLPISGSYLGLGVYTVLPVPNLLTKQFNLYWEQGRQVRLGKQMYLFGSTDAGKCTINLYINQNSSEAANQLTSDSGSIYSQTLLTYKESDLNINSERIWHRISQSVLGDTVQIGVTLNEEQMLDPTLAAQTSSLTLHAIVLDLYPGPLLAL
jgi:hypothetical protein